MKTLPIICAFSLLLAGCADKDAYNAYMKTFSASAENYYLAASEPLLEVELPSPVDGQPYKITVNREVKPMAPEQVKDSEWASVARTGLGVIGTVGTTYVVTDGVVNLAGEVADASGIHVNGDHANLTAVGNKSSAGDHGTSSAGGREDARVNVEGEGNSGSMDNPAPVTETRTTTTSINKERNTTTEAAP